MWPPGTKIEPVTIKIAKHSTAFFWFDKVNDCLTNGLYFSCRELINWLIQPGKHH